MRSARIRRHVVAVIGPALVLGCWCLGPAARLARADRVPPTAAIAGPSASDHYRFPARGSSSRRSSGTPAGSGGWWLGTAGVALALAVVGGIGVASKRFLPQSPSAVLRVVGRTSLSPKHTVFLLQAGRRVLIVGAGPQGAPSLLGELTDPEELERFASSGTSTSTPSTLFAGFGRRVGGDA